MRTIKFRGKRIKDGKWIYGNLANYSSNFLSLNINKFVIFENIASFATDNFGFVVDDCEVVHDTIGQFTGLFDNDGKEIYEGDIFQVKAYEPKFEVFFKNGVFEYRQIGIPNRPYPLRRIYFDSYVLGNIHDNPELLKIDTK